MNICNCSHELIRIWYVCCNADILTNQYTIKNNNSNRSLGNLENSYEWILKYLLGFTTLLELNLQFIEYFLKIILYVIMSKTTLPDFKTDCTKLLITYENFNRLGSNFLKGCLQKNKTSQHFLHSPNFTRRGGTMIFFNLC